MSARKLTTVGRASEPSRKALRSFASSSRLAVKSLKYGQVKRCFIQEKSTMDGPSKPCLKDYYPSREPGSATRIRSKDTVHIKLTSQETMMAINKELEVWLSYGAEIKLNSEQEHLNYVQTLLDSFFEPRFREITGEVDVLVDGVTFKSHGILLEHHNPNLAGIVATNRFAKKSSIDLTSVPADVFSVIDRWMYGQRVDLGVVGLDRLLNYAFELGFENFTRECESKKNEFTSSWRYSQQMFDFAQQRGNRKLASMALDRMTTSFSDIVASEEFLNYSCSAVCHLLSLDAIYAKDETEVLRAALRWLLHQDKKDPKQDRWKHGEEVFNCVRLENMTPNEFLAIGINLLRDSDDSGEDGIIFYDDEAPPIKNRQLTEAWNRRKSSITRHFLSTLIGLESETKQKSRRNLGKIPPSLQFSTPAAIKTCDSSVAIVEKLEYAADPGSTTDEEDGQSIRLEILLSPQRQSSVECEGSRNGPSSGENDPVKLPQHEWLNEWLSHVMEIEMNDCKQRASRCLKFIRFLRDILVTSDLTVSCKGQMFNIHRLLMAHHVPDLLELLFVSSDNLKAHVIIRGLSAHSFSAFVNWMYASNLEICGPTGVSYSRMLTIGRRLGCPGMLDRFQRLQTEILDPSFALLVIRTAREREDGTSSDDLSEEIRPERIARDHVTRDFLAIVRGHEFPLLNVVDVKLILANNDIYIERESDVLTAAVRWLNSAPGARSNCASDVLSCVRWSLMDATELVHLSSTGADTLEKILTPVYPHWRFKLARAARHKLEELCDFKPLLDSSYHADQPRNNLGRVDIASAPESIFKCHPTEKYFKPDLAGSRITIRRSLMDGGDVCKTFLRGQEGGGNSEIASSLIDDKEFELESNEVSSVSDGDRDRSAPTKSKNFQKEKRRDFEASKPDVRETLMEVRSAVKTSSKSIVLFGEAPISKGRTQRPSARSFVGHDNLDDHGGHALNVWFLNWRSGGRWESTGAKMPDRRKNAVALLLDDDTIYVTGGTSSDEECAISSVLRYDLRRDRWKRTCSMLEPRAYHGGAACRGLLYVVGGTACQLDRVLDTVEAYDPSTSRWTSVQPMLKARALLSVAAHRNKVWAVGGVYFDNEIDNEQQLLDHAEYYDPHTNSWTTVSRLRFPRMGSVLVSFPFDGDRLYLLGGRVREIDGVVHEVTDVDVYEKGEWRRETQLSEPRGRLVATVFVGRVLLVAATHLSTLSTSVIVECYDPKHRCWLPKDLVPKMPIILNEFGCFSVPLANLNPRMP